ncbi:MAG TPA: ATP-binding protein [Polyangiaceae bacterium]|jgi:PAS domain S-box-containing protein
MHRVREITTIGLGLALAVMVVVALLGYHTFEALLETARGVEHTRQVIETLDQIVLNTTAAGRARRSYSLTRDESNLPRIDAAISEVRADVRKVGMLTVDNPHQRERIDRLEPLLTRRFDDLAAAVTAQRVSGPDLAREDAIARAGSDLMSRIGKVVDEMMVEERTLLVERQARADRSAAFAKSVELGGTGVAITIILIAFAGLRRENKRRMRSEQEKERANRFLDSIVEHIPDMIFVKEARELRFERLNRAGEALLGVTREELLGKNDQDLFAKSQADFFQGKDREALSRGDVLDIEEEPVDTKRGRRWLHTKKVPILGDDGAPAYLLGISEDVTERKESAAALRAAIDAAERSNLELESFSYSVAHDLRAPLRSIDGFGLALIEDCSEELSDQGKQYLERIRVATQRMGQLIDGLLALARVSRAEIHFETVDLSALARASVEELRYGASEREVAVLIQANLVTRGDPRLLRIVLDNLLGNAFKFTSTRSAAHVELGTIQEDGELVYFVRDDGVGFDRQYADKLFGAFQRLHDAAQFPGTGIGLATVHRVVARHGGRIWAHGEPDRGATFYFTLGHDGQPNRVAAE